VANRLAAEPSPYLRQHAENPVDWYPWGDEAFERARALDRPVLLSVGYAACHWCHVMAHESFEDPAVAAVLNAHFVAVKVDREERPDVDAVYQTICQLVTRQGGWPLTCFLTPELQPFYVGTYFPPQPRYGRPGFSELAAGLAGAWKDDRTRVLEVAVEWTGALHRSAEPPAAAPRAAPARPVLAQAAQALRAELDPIHGGFGDAPKFPHTEALEVLLRCGGHAGAAAVFALRAMAGGGIYDQLGGGFHRYSVDAAWQVPHFEKMLYDNALLPPLYLAAYQRTGDAEFARVARETLDYLRRDLGSPEGAFYSSEDADSLDGAGQLEEGAFYTWTPAEVAEALGGPDEAAAACRHFGVTEAGNFEGGRSVLHLDALALPADAVAGLRATLLARRGQRPRPARDEKVLAGWNGLAIGALARAGRILAEPRYTAAADRAARFILSALRSADGGLWRRYRDGVAGIPGTLEDYAYLASGLLDLYEASLRVEWLSAALDLARAAVARFWEPEQAACYLTERGARHLIERPRDDGDSGTPAAQSVLLQALLRLQPYADGTWCAEIPAAVLGRNAALLARHPRGLGSLLCALDLATDPLEVVLAVPDGQPIPEDWLSGLRARYLPNLLLSRVAEAPGLAAPPAWQGRSPVGEQPALWVCRGQTCLLPARRWAEVEHALP